MEFIRYYKLEHLVLVKIGIILCGERRQFDVEYALRGIDKPIGVAGYELTRELPEKLKNFT